MPHCTQWVSAIPSKNSSSVGADYVVSKNNADDEIGPSTVTLSEAKGLSPWAARCFAALSMTVR